MNNDKNSSGILLDSVQSELVNGTIHDMATNAKKVYRVLKMSDGKNSKLTEVLKDHGGTFTEEFMTRYTIDHHNYQFITFMENGIKYYPRFQMCGGLPINEQFVMIINILHNKDDIASIFFLLTIHHDLGITYYDILRTCDHPRYVYDYIEHKARRLHNL